jgi:hypothetical protein
VAQRFANAGAVTVATPLKRDPLGGIGRRMSESDILLTTAEIAVAFAGFASLISVIGRGSATDPRLAAFLLRFALEVAVFVVAFSLIPLLPLNYGLEPDSAWRLSSFLFVVASQLATFGMSRRFRRSELALSTPTMATVVVLSIGADLLLLVNALGFFGSAVFPVYLTALFANLGLAGFYFLLVVDSVFPSSDGHES